MGQFAGHCTTLATKIVTYNDDLLFPFKKVRINAGYRLKLKFIFYLTIVLVRSEGKNPGKKSKLSAIMRRISLFLLTFLAIQSAFGQDQNPPTPTDSDQVGWTLLHYYIRWISLKHVLVYRRPSLSADLLSANSHIHIGKNGPKWLFTSQNWTFLRFLVLNEGTANNGGNLRIVNPVITLSFSLNKVSFGTKDMTAYLFR